MRIEKAIVIPAPGGHYNEDLNTMCHSQKFSNES